MTKVRIEQDWHNIYDVLVEKGGAAESMRTSFVSCCLDGELTEWRFQGHLGFGGKIWLTRHTGELRVYCYTEDLNAKRKRIIAAINALLADM